MTIHAASSAATTAAASSSTNCTGEIPKELDQKIVRILKNVLQHINFTLKGKCFDGSHRRLPSLRLVNFFEDQTERRAFRYSVYTALQELSLDSESAAESNDASSSQSNTKKLCFHQNEVTSETKVPKYPHTEDRGGRKGIRPVFTDLDVKIINDQEGRSREFCGSGDLSSEGTPHAVNLHEDELDRDLLKSLRESVQNRFDSKYETAVNLLRDIVIRELSGGFEDSEINLLNLQIPKTFGAWAKAVGTEIAPSYRDGWQLNTHHTNFTRKTEPVI